MKELRNFIKGLKRLEYKTVGVQEVFSDEEDAMLVDLDDVIREVKEIGIKEVVGIYNEAFEIITNDDKYIEIVAVY